MAKTPLTAQKVMRSPWERHAVARRRSKLWLTYTLTPEAYQALHDQRNGTCAICGDCAAKRSLHVDHDHVTGTVRGLLCNSCNRGMGLLKDDAAVLEAAIVYLKRTAA